MKLVGFEIEHFKGIRRAAIRFSENDTARIHTLVGLNESGKTTLLEAMHSFSPDAETELVVKSATSVDEQREQWVHRDKISNFTGEVSIRAHVVCDEADWDSVLSMVERARSLKIQRQKMPENFILTLAHEYSRGDYISSELKANIPELLCKSGRSKNFRPINSEEMQYLLKTIRSRIPVIAYYPTFVFSFPEKIYLTDRDKSARNKFYRQLFQDILDYDNDGYTIEESIINRTKKPEHLGPWAKWFGSFSNSSDEEKVKQVISRAQRAVTKVVFSAWNEVFGETVGKKEVEIELGYEGGLPREASNGIKLEAQAHDVYIRFWIREGTSRYAVEHRSLGFRWFFSFLLFTQFRIHREKSRATIFLFDEPASNLHAAAQKKLLDSFPAIAKPPHRLIYSTHSHYMVEPAWLEQAYIIYNKHASPSQSIVDEATSDDTQIDVKAIPYREFVQKHPDSTSYFQPILDTLEVQPSKFDYAVGGVIAEGKSDYYYLKLASKVAKVSEPVIFPATGAGTMGSLVSLHRGWGLPVNVLFDDDQGARDGRKSLKDFGLLPGESFTLAELSGKVTHIEDIISLEDQRRLTEVSGRVDKRTLLRAVQELLASGRSFDFDATTISTMSEVLKALQTRAPHAFVVRDNQLLGATGRPRKGKSA